jgi:hypothetical protein
MDALKRSNNALSNAGALELGINVNCEGEAM